MSDTEMLLRNEWWNGHGCDPAARYGDDGEMQCGQCGADFKRCPFAELERHVVARRTQAGLLAYDAIERAKTMAEVETLEYIIRVCRARESLTMYTEAYRAGARDVRVSAQASIERVKRGDRMESTIDLMESAPPVGEPAPWGCTCRVDARDNVIELNPYCTAHKA